MSKTLINDLIEQYKHTFRIVNQEIERFTDQDWLEGFSFFQVPVNQAVHLLDCLDFYFREDEVDDYQWGYRFGGGWWELDEEQLPGKNEVLDYTRELEYLILEKLASLDDVSLSETSPIQFEWAQTRLGLYIYALRHTLHHHGELAALAVYHGHEGGSWE